MGKIIEFFGPPGAGKSTLAKYTTRYLTNENIKALNHRIGKKKGRYIGYKRWSLQNNSDEYSFLPKYSKQNKILNFLIKIIPEKLGDEILLPNEFKYREELINRFILNNLDLYNILNENIDKLYQSLNKKEIMHTKIKNDFYKYQNCKDFFQDEIIVLDEALCQRLSTIYHPHFAEKSDLEWKEDMMKITSLIAKKIDCAFYVKASPKICNKRQMNRGSTIDGFHKKNKEKDRLFGLEMRVKHFNIIYKTLSRNNVRTFKVNSEGLLEPTINQLEGHLDKIISNLKN